MRRGPRKRKYRKALKIVAGGYVALFFVGLVATIALGLNWSLVLIAKWALLIEFMGALYFAGQN